MSDTAQTLDDTLPEPYRLLPIGPTPDEYLMLRRIGGLGPFSKAAAEVGARGHLYAVTLFHGQETIGMGRIIGDGGCFYQIVDIVVSPDHQGKGLGKAIMRALMTFMETQPATAYVSLIADLPADKLYEQFGFEPTTPKSIGMARRVP
ncbi:MAG: GNAT family N-acetyltransferase [Pseudomonadota bacterium]